MAALLSSFLVAPSTELSSLLSHHGHNSTTSITLTPQEAASGILGSVSVAAWVFVIVPQLIENYRASSAAAISVPFLLIWCLGDMLNFAGAVWAGLVPTAVALSAYFCFSDVFLIGQCLYYNIRDWRRNRAAAKLEQETGQTSEAAEDEPLLQRRRHLRRRESAESRSSNIGMPGSHVPFDSEERRNSFGRNRRSASSGRPELGDRAISSESVLHKIDEDDVSTKSRVHPSTGRKVRSILKKCAVVVIIFIIGAAGWMICYKTGIWKPSPPPGSSSKTTSLKTNKRAGTMGGEILGYISAALYLGARIPQIIKNWRDKSCEGLSFFFFLLSLLGNLTYGAGILAHSLEKEYLIVNTPWLLGSLGTIAEDVTIFAQFHIYGDQRKAEDDGRDSQEEIQSSEATRSEPGAVYGSTNH